MRLPSWALERQFETRLRGYPERTEDPEPGGRAGDVRLPWPDLRSFVPLLDLDDTARDAAIAARDADVAARTVRLTLDARLQARLAALVQAEVGKRHRAAAAAVIDVETGQVIARVQAPDYDPNQPTWQDHVLAGDAAFLPRFYGAYGEWPDKTGTQGMFQSGSVGKLFTAIAAVRSLGTWGPAPAASLLRRVRRTDIASPYRGCPRSQ